MLKKAAHIILAFYLLTTIVGFSVTKHNCGDSIFSVELESTDNCSCDAYCDMSCGMCKLETHYIHLTVDFVVEHSLELNPVLDFIISPYILLIDDTDDFQLAFPTLNNSRPPVLSVSQRLALIQSFRC